VLAGALPVLVGALRMVVGATVAGGAARSLAAALVGFAAGFRGRAG
jgi:hypothetical protein